LADKTKKLRQELLSLAGNWLNKLLKNFSITDYLQLMDLLTRLETNARSTLVPEDSLPYSGDGQKVMKRKLAEEVIANLKSEGVI
jgi:hypothetical protein